MGRENSFWLIGTEAVGEETFGPDEGADEDEDGVDEVVLVAAGATVFLMQMYLRSPSPLE